MNNFILLKELLENNNSFLLTTHVNPDPDALGSELALYEILTMLNKKIRIVNYSATPYNLEFLDEKKVIEKYDETLHANIFQDADVCILLDLNQANRIVKMEKGLRDFNGIKVCIDHHKDPEDFVNYFIGGDNYSATGEIIYDFIQLTKIAGMNKRIAEMIYVAIMTDTGSFRFERTTSKIHRIIADLLSYGINPTIIYDKVYDQFRVGRIKLLGETLSTIELEANGKMAVMKVTKEALKRNEASEADIDGFVNYCLSIQNVLLGILIYEQNDGVKISFRSKGDIAVNKLAQQFGGGGHSNAAGAKLNHTSIESAKDKIIKAALTYLS